MRYIILTFVLWFSFNNLNTNWAEIINDHQEIITKDDDVQKYMYFLRCPQKLLGTICPENSLTYYYYCCGDLKDKCCYTTRTWIIFICLAVPVFIFTVILSYFIRKIICSHPNQYIVGERQL